MRVTISGFVAAAFLMATSGSPAAAEPVGAGWDCASPEEWSAKAVKPVPTLTLNNFFFAEADRASTTMKALELSYSLTNRDDTQFNITGQFVGLDGDDNVLFAMSVSPMFGKARPGTRTISGHVYVPFVVLPSTARVCAAFAVDPRT